MKKILAVIFIVLLSFNPSFADDVYDPQHTMLALNMAIVSINRILTTQDRVVLEWEYDNIINRLAFGNIESDSEMIELYRELMNFIVGKKLRQEELKRIHESVEQRQKEAYYTAMKEGFANFSSNRELRTNDKKLRTNSILKRILEWVGNTLISTISSVGTGYYGYQYEKERIHREIDAEAWQLKKDEIEACNVLQEKLLNSSWRLLRQYRLSDEYRLTKPGLTKFFKAMDEKESSTRLKMLQMIERDFMVYPPYWFFRARTAFDAGNNAESEKCFEKFNEVWRPVLRKDIYKLEASKYKISSIIREQGISEKSLDEIKSLVETIREYTPEEDWSSNLFAGFVYYALGEKDKAVACLEENILFDYEKDISEPVLEQMKNNDADFASIPEALSKAEAYKIVASMNNKDVGRALIEWFTDSKEAETTFERLAETNRNPVVFHVLGIMEGHNGNYFRSIKFFQQRNDEDKNAFIDVLKLAEYFAEKRSKNAQTLLGSMYFLGLGMKRDNQKAFNFFRVPAGNGDCYAQDMIGVIYRSSGYYQNAYEYFQMSAEQGYAHAQYELANMYTEGKVVDVNFRKAIELYKKAAVQGNHIAAFFLGNLLYDVESGAKSYYEAYKWCYLAFLLTDSKDPNMMERFEGLTWYELPQESIENAIEEANRMYDEILRKNGMKRR